jgi:hypothetical protein
MIKVHKVDVGWRLQNVCRLEFDSYMPSILNYENVTELLKVGCYICMNI